MDFKESLKIMRTEIGMTQSELAAALQINKKSVSRWEQGKSFPHMKTINKVLTFAKQKGVSTRCLQNLQSALPAERTKVLRISKSKLYPVDKESICDLVDDSHTAIYVCSLETDEVLYANKKAEEYAGRKFKAGEKCYQFLHGHNTPCQNCPKEKMLESESSHYHMVLPKNGKDYLFRGRKLIWNGQPAHAQYFFEETTALDGREAYRKLLNQLDVGVCVYWVHDDGQIEMDYLSDGYFAIVGSAREKWMQYAGYGIMDAVCEEDRQRVHDIAVAASKAGRPIRMIYKVKLEDGSLKELYTRAKFIKRENQKSLYYSTIEDSDRALNRDRGGNEDGV